MDWSVRWCTFCATEGNCNGGRLISNGRQSSAGASDLSRAPTLLLEAADPVEDRADFISGQSVAAMIPVTRLLQILVLKKAQ